MAIKLTAHLRTDADFYTVIGPFLANRAVHKFVGDAIWDDPGKTWYIAQDSAGDVHGFIAHIVRRRRAIIESLYTLDHDDTRLAARLVGHAVAEHGRDSHLHATVRHAHAAAYTAHGFTVASETVNFAVLVRAADLTQDA